MRTIYISKITMTARERSSLYRWLDTPCRMIKGDHGLVEGIMRRVLENARLVDKPKLSSN